MKTVVFVNGISYRPTPDGYGCSTLAYIAINCNVRKGLIFFSEKQKIERSDKQNDSFALFYVFYVFYVFSALNSHLKSIIYNAKTLEIYG